MSENEALPGEAPSDEVPLEEAFPIEALPDEATAVEVPSAEATPVEFPSAEATPVEVSSVEATPVEFPSAEATPVEFPSAEATAVQAFQISRSLQDALECPVCLEYMTPPITMCSSGHSLCQVCRPRLSRCPTCRRPLLGIRNYALEHLARDLQLPPRPVPVPVPEATFMDTCSYEQEYGCPLDCSWRGRHSKVREHTSGMHPDKILEGRGENSCRWELPLIVKDTRVMFALGEVFLYRQRLHTIKKVFYILVQYFGPQEEASKYKYEVELCSGSGAQKMTVIGNVTLHYEEDADAVYEAGNCVTLEYDVVKKVSEGSLVYSVRVFKPSSVSV